MGQRDPWSAAEHRVQRFGERLGDGAETAVIAREDHRVGAQPFGQRDRSPVGQLAPEDSPTPATTLTGPARNAAMSGTSPGVLAQLAARGLGIAIVPASVAQAREDLHPLAITRPALRGCLAFAWRTEGPISPAARALVAKAQRILNTG
jgi:DNA-binding transcriptional LysR family regulator